MALRNHEFKYTINYYPDYAEIKLDAMDANVIQVDGGIKDSSSFVSPIYKIEYNKDFSTDIGVMLNSMVVNYRISGRITKINNSIEKSVVSVSDSPFINK